jgi:hypothetical protein
MRSFFTIAAICFISGSVSAQTANLSESIASRDCTRVEIRTKVDGERIYYQDGTPKKQAVKLEAGHRCVERVLNVNDKTGLPSKTVRNYEAARSNLIIGSERPTQQALRTDRAFIVAMRGDDALTVFSPKGPLTREELELIGEHFDTLALQGLLPGKQLEVGASWELSNHTALGLCQFEGLESHTLSGRLEAVAGNQAKISISGNAKGIDGGAQVVLTISATATFDIAKRKIVGLEWKQEDQRDQGPLSPGFKATVTVMLTRTVIDEPAELNDAALAMVPAGMEAPAGMTAIVYRDPQGRFDLTHPREWRMTSATDQHTTMRLVERGDLVAQVNITTLDRAAPGQHMDPAEFKDKMMASPGWEPGEVIEESEIKGRADRFVYRLSAAGMIDGKQIVQTFYLVAGGNGAQAVVAFQTQPQKIAKLAGRDLVFVEGFEPNPKR